MTDIIETLEKLCALDAPSGAEGEVRDFILNEIKDFAQCETDNMGNIIAFKKGKTAPSKKLMLDAHMDEVGFIVTGIDGSGLIKFSTLGGIDTNVIVGRRVRFLKDKTLGVVGVKPVHLCSQDEKKNQVKKDDLYIDIGALNREEALQKVKPGDFAVFEGGLESFGDGKLCGKAVDDRAGCAILIDMIKSEIQYDMYFTFTVQEEVGLRGAKAAAFAIAPDFALVVEATTAADILGVPEEGRVCTLGGGAAVSFMDRSTVYDREMYELCFEIAKEKGIKCQPKAAVAGGNNSGEIHRSRAGVRTAAISVPCRYLHSAVCVSSRDDIMSAAALVRAVAEKILSL